MSTTSGPRSWRHPFLRRRLVSHHLRGGSAGREAGAYFTDAKELPLSGPFQAEVLREVVTLPRVGTRQLAGYKIMTPEDQQQRKAQLFAGADSSQVLKLLCPA